MHFCSNSAIAMELHVAIAITASFKLSEKLFNS